MERRKTNKYCKIFSTVSRGGKASYSPPNPVVPQKYTEKAKGPLLSLKPLEFYKVFPSTSTSTSIFKLQLFMTTIHPLPFSLFCRCHMIMGRSPTVLLFLALLSLFVNVANGIMCRSCEGDMCTYNAMTINCQFPVRACMRIYSSQTGRTYKAGCLYPIENCDRAQFISGEQMRCSSCTFDNCNSIPSPYGGMDPQQQDRYGPPYGPGGGGQGPPYYPGDGRYNRPPYGRDGRYGYFWNEAFSARRWTANSTLLLFLIFPFLGILSFLIFVRN